MGKGGRRPGAGRPPNSRTARSLLDEATGQVARLLVWLGTVTPDAAALERAAAVTAAVGLRASRRLLHASKLAGRPDLRRGVRGSEALDVKP
jgi:hypothetical protein